jgi:hypothetical protein
MICLNDKSDEDVRYMLFERINTGSADLTKMEMRNGAYRGQFTDFLYEISEEGLFKKHTRFTKYAIDRGEPQELILRFFAYSDKYLDFKKSVNDFLNDYIKEKNEKFDKTKMKKEFIGMMKFIDQYLPNVLIPKENYNSVNRVRFESLSVGINLALRQKRSMI